MSLSVHMMANQRLVCLGFIYAVFSLFIVSVRGVLSVHCLLFSSVYVIVTVDDDHRHSCGI